MKLDKFEKYIKENRDQLDGKEPPAGSWERIASQLNKPHHPGMIYWRAAAVLFFVLSLGLLINNFRGNEATELAGLDPEFTQTEQYYFEVIEDKEVLLTTYLKDYPELAGDFKQDLQELTRNYNKLKTEFEKNRSEEVLSALIKNLQLQQDLLNNQLKIIHQINEENENISI